jgi:hypothetical protein
VLETNRALCPFCYELTSVRVNFEFNNLILFACLALPQTTYLKQPESSLVLVTNW